MTDAAGKPLAGATVAVMSLGDPSSPAPEFREAIELKPTAGPLTATTDAAGRARFPNLPPTRASFAATRPGFAETICFDGQSTIRLTPAASLEGTLTGPDGQPLPGITVKLSPGFMWDFEFARTDDRGRYKLDSLRARGWDMAAWRPGSEGDGSYKLWIEGDEFAIPTQGFTLEPNERRVLDLKAEQAGVIRVEVIEEGTGRSVSGVRVWGFDQETGRSSRFNAHTDARGVATFHSLPTRISLSIVGPPAGFFFDRGLFNATEAHTTFDFPGGDWDETLTMPRIGGRLVAVAGECVGPDGKPMAGVTVHAGSAPAKVPAAIILVPPRQPGAAPPPPPPQGAEPAMIFIRSRQTDTQGRFLLEGVPAGRDLGLYAIGEDGKLGGWLTAKVTEEGRPEQPIRLVLQPTVEVDLQLSDKQGKPLPLRECSLTPKLAGDLTLLRRTLKSDAQGQVRVDQVVAGLTYHLVDEPPVEQRLPNGGFLRSKANFDVELILAPLGGGSP